LQEHADAVADTEPVLAGGAVVHEHLTAAAWRPALAVVGETEWT
jgi:hypothetical protein